MTRKENVTVNHGPGNSLYPEQSGPYPAYYFLGSINDSDTGDNVPPWMEVDGLEVNGTDLNFKIDSGAEVNGISSY